MPVQLRVMSWNIQKRTNTTAYIAELMRLHQIDVAALLEMPNSNVAATLAQLVADLNNLAVPYHQNDWLWQDVNVGDESVGYVWRQNNAVGPNAFRVDIMANGGQRVFGAVKRNTANARIFFPETSTNWGGLPGTPDGRRPAYLSFVTNDGAPARRFTVLDIHTPFPDGTSIQSYATSLIATSREITQVDRTDLPAIATAGSVGLAAALAITVDPIIAGMGDHTFVVPAVVRADVVAGAGGAIDGDEINLTTLVRAAGRAGVESAMSNLVVPPRIDEDDGQELARAIGVAAAGAAAALVATAQLPTGPVGATASAAAARDAAMTRAQVVAGQLQLPSKRPKGGTAVQQQDAVRTEALRIADRALAPVTFNALPLSAVNVSVIAGDFNVDYPDINTYDPSYKLKMGGANYNAYTRLLALGPATNTARSTRTGPTAFRGQLVYQLHTPCPIQCTNKALANYVPLDMATLAGTPTSYMNWTNWTNDIRSMARTQGVAFSTLKTVYGAQINNAFDKQTNNDTRYYRKNCYDNIFVRGGAVTASGVIDVINELGSWGAGAAAFVNPKPAIAPNPWGAATGGLNALAQAAMAMLPLTYTYNTSKYSVPYTITAALADGIEAAVFFDRYISDHLPVFVEVRL